MLTVVAVDSCLNNDPVFNISRSGWRNKETGRRINGGRDSLCIAVVTGIISMWKVRIVMFSGLP